MTIHLQHSEISSNNALINITGSKSESNRLLLLQALYPEISIENLSNSDDSVLMQNALASDALEIDIHHAGTAMRFLTAYFAIQKQKETILTGSSRMKERPIKILVDALKQLGADITYLENEGFPPLKITGKNLKENNVSLEANVSSQYISALLLIASRLENGLTLNLKGKITSVPYIKMTLNLLNQVGISTHFNNNTIAVKPQNKTLKPQVLTVESDWSSVSYFYSCVALSKVGTQLELASYKANSLQGDSVLSEIYNTFGVTTTFNDTSITLQKTSEVKSETHVNLDLSNAPDIAQTIAVTAFGLGISCYLTGLHTLKIKETDRLVALKTELEKLGGFVNITEASLALSAVKQITANVSIATYNDHRMAMAFAPLALKTNLTIENADVVSKSYPEYWQHLKGIGFKF